jgi:hypothetical protein
MLRGLWDGAGKVGPLSLDALVRYRVTVFGTHTVYRRFSTVIRPARRVTRPTRSFRRFA